MKTIKFFVLAAIIIAGFTRCISDGADPVGGENPVVEEGIPTYATFNFVVEENGPGTRAGEAMISDAGEASALSRVSRLRLLIFKTGSTSTCEVNQSVSVGSSADSIITVKLTSGDKRIFVIANESTGIATLLNGVVTDVTTLAEFYDKYYDLGTGLAGVANPVAFPAYGLDSLIRLVSTSTGYVMSNPIDANSLKTLQAGVDSTGSRTGNGDPDLNNFVFSIQRTVAKTSIALQSASVANTTDGKGSLELNSIGYVAKNVSRSLYLFQKFATDNIVLSPSPTSPLDQEPRTPYYLLNSTAEVTNYPTRYYAGYSTFVSIPTSAATTAVYLTENTNAVPQTGNMTYVAIEGKFSPAAQKAIITPYASYAAQIAYNDVTKTFTVDPAAALNSSPLNINAADTLYQLRGVGETYGLPDSIFFTDRSVAYRVAYIIKNGSDAGFNLASIDSYGLTYDKELNATGTSLIAKYLGGKCYYRLNLGQPAPDGSIVFGVKRNHHYKAVISAFSTIGDPNIGDLNFPPGTPLGGTTFVTARITIDAWRDVDLQPVL
jgi:hypothetical protein